MHLRMPTYVNEMPICRYMLEYVTGTVAISHIWLPVWCDMFSYILNTSFEKVLCILKTIGVWENINYVVIHYIYSGRKSGLSLTYVVSCFS